MSLPMMLNYEHERQNAVQKFYENRENRYHGPDTKLRKQRGLNPKFDERNSELNNLSEDRPWHNNGLQRYKRVPEIAFIQEQKGPDDNRNYDIYRNLLTKERLGLGGSTVHLVSHVEPFDSHGFVKPLIDDPLITAIPINGPNIGIDIQNGLTGSDSVHSINLIDSIINDATINTYNKQMYGSTAPFADINNENDFLSLYKNNENGTNNGTNNGTKYDRFSLDLKHLKESNWFFPVLIIIFCVFLYFINKKLKGL